MKIIILAGGIGTRLWPLSRGKYPKQFVKLNGMDRSILQMTLERCLKLAGLEDIFLVTNGEYRDIIAGQMEGMGLTPIHENILAEPMAKNTLPAIYNGVKHIRSTGDDTVAVFPSDHLINDVEGFCDAVHRAEGLAETHIVTFGIKASTPETGYGYIQPGAPLGQGFEVSAFKEKPRLELAEQYKREGYFWNAGMFMFNTALFDEEVRRHCPEVYRAFEHDTVEQCFAASPSISVDYGVMEHSGRVAVVPMHNDWSDLGSFQSIYEAYSGLMDSDGNVAGENCIVVDSRNSMVLGNTGKPIALVGMENAVVIDYDDAALVCSMEKTQQVRLVVDELKKRGSRELDVFSVQQRPWGSVRLVHEDEGYRVKRLAVLPGKAVEKHMHKHCAQSWTVVRGKALATVGGEQIQMETGSMAAIETGQAHALANAGNDMLEVIEVQTGSFPEGDFIIL